MGEQDSKSCGFEYFIKKYFPLTEDNVFGVIPLIGFASSCITSGLLTGTIQDGLSGPWTDHFAPWLFTGLLVFSVLQTSWGFHAEHKEVLFLWMISKSVEIGGNLVAVASLGFRFSSAILGCALVNLFLIIALLHVGYTKYKPLKKAYRDNLLMQEQNLNNKIDV